MYKTYIVLYPILGVLSSVISSAASLMVLSKIAKGEIIQSGYLKKHLGKPHIDVFHDAFLKHEFRLQAAGRFTNPKCANPCRSRVRLSSFFSESTKFHVFYPILI